MDQKQAQNTTTHSFYARPDNCHLNERGALYMADLILAKIEELEGEVNEKD